MKKLVKGILDFRKNILTKYRKEFAHLAKGQAPDTLFVGCSDSRVVPNLMASTSPGDLFMVRNVGNLIPPYTDLPAHPGAAEAAAIEFSLLSLPVKEIVICGHSNCGAMHAILEGLESIKSPHLREWLKNCRCTPDQMKPVKGLSKADCFAQANVLQQIEHLMTYPLIQKRVKSGKLRLHGWYFDLGTGDVYAYEKENDAFILIDEEEGKRILDRLG